MGQDCSVYSVWTGHCNVWEMLTGEVIAALLTVIVAIVAVMVTIKQIKKQEELTREQLKKQEELTREQIAATMEATRKQLEEMRKLQEPKVDIVTTSNGLTYMIEVLNTRNVPVYITGYELDVKWSLKDREYSKNDFDLNAILLEYFHASVPEETECKVLNIGDTYQLAMKKDFFQMISEGKRLVNYSPIRREEKARAEFVKIFDEKLDRIEVQFKFHIPDLETEFRLEVIPSQLGPAGRWIQIKELGTRVQK